MTERQREYLITEVMEVLKLSESMRRSAERYVRRAVDRILIYCNREDLPDQLLTTAAYLACDMLKADAVVAGDKEVSGITRGDTSISYRSDAAAVQGAVDLMKDYRGTLDHLRYLCDAETPGFLWTEKVLSFVPAHLKVIMEYLKEYSGEKKSYAGSAGSKSFRYRVQPIELNRKVKKNTDIDLQSGGSCHIRLIAYPKEA